MRFHNHVISLMDEGTYGEKIRELGVPITSIGMKSGVPTLLSCNKLLKTVKEAVPDIIQGWMYHGNFAAYFAQRYAASKSHLLWNIRHSLYDLSYEKGTTRFVIKTNRFFSAKPIRILYNSRISRRQHEDFGFSSKRGMVIPNGIDVEKFVPCPEKARLVRTQLAIPDNAFVIGHVARFHPMKDHHLFLRSAAKLAKKYNNIYFLLCGRNVVPENMKLLSAIPQSLCQRFIFLGERHDIPELFCAMDCFSSSSYGEGFPNVVGEAMASGIPCVVTNVGDSAYIVGDAGIVVPPRDSLALAAGLEKIFLMTDDERKQLQKKARARIVERFSLSAIVKQYIDIYESIFQGQLG